MKEKRGRVDWLRLLEAFTGWALLLIIVVALILAAIVPMLQWNADMQACMRMLGLTEQNCSDYLRLIRE